MISAILIASIAWFITAAILFFNPIVDKPYNSTVSHPSVKALPKTPATIGKILFAIVVQCILWALVYKWVNPALPGDDLSKGLFFGTIIFFMKMIPRDIDRLLLTTYPTKRMFIEFVIGGVCSYVVGFCFSYFI